MRNRPGNTVADIAFREKSALLPRALIIHEEEAQFLTHHGAPEASTENILLQHRPAWPCALRKYSLALRYVVSEKFVSVSMELLGAGPQDGVDVPSTIAALARIVERRLHLEFLNHVRVWQRRVCQFCATL